MPVRIVLHIGDGAGFAQELSIYENEAAMLGSMSSSAFVQGEIAEEFEDTMPLKVFRRQLDLLIVIIDVPKQEPQAPLFDLKIALHAA